jgi:acyl-CoA hydrolase
MAATKLVFGSGERVFLPGGSGTPGSLGAAVFAAPNVRVTTTYVPGVNRISPDAIGPGSSVTGFFMFPALGDAQRSGAFRHLPMSYSAIVQWLKDQKPFDCCVVQVSAPDKGGRASLGPAAEFTPSVLRRAKRVIAVVNPRVPFVADAPGISISECAQILEHDEPLVTYGAGEVDPLSIEVATRVAPFIADGAVLQLGLGKVPTALTGLLRDRRRLRLHSGMLSEGIMGLSEAGALDGEWAHMTTMFLGSTALYEWIAYPTGICIRGCEETHDPRRLGTMERFVAVNTALSVDLFGQCNLETAGGRALSGCGGAPDFARAARASPGGLSIVALPASAGTDHTSRIVSKLGTGGIATLARTEVDVVITDMGAADLRGLSVVERAEALIAIAPPAARSGLSDEWREILGRL